MTDKNKQNQSSKDFSRSETAFSDRVARLVNFLEDRGYVNEKGKRIYRKAKDRPRPDLPPDAEQNKLQPLFQARIDRELLDLVEEFRTHSGMTKKDIAEQALTLFLANQEMPDSDPE